MTEPGTAGRVRAPSGLVWPKEEMRIDSATASARDLYLTLISTLVPRPIAWVATRSAAGVPNLAPFSFFMGVVADPPTLAFSVGRKDDGTPKDTARNILISKDFVVNVVPFALAPAMVQTSAELPYEVDEAVFAGLTLAPAGAVQADRVVGSPVQLECTLFQHVPISSGATITADLFIGRIQAIAVDDAVLDARGRVDPSKLDAVGRMGGALYCRTQTLFEVARPRP